MKLVYPLRDGEAVALVDVAPTLFDILRAPGFPSQGKSLLPRIGDSSAEGFAFSQRRARMRRDGPRAKKWRQAGVEHYAVQDGRYKLILYVSKNGEKLGVVASECAAGCN